MFQTEPIIYLQSHGTPWFTFLMILMTTLGSSSFLVAGFSEPGAAEDVEPRAPVTVNLALLLSGGFADECFDLVRKLRLTGLALPRSAFGRAAIDRLRRTRTSNARRRTIPTSASRAVIRMTSAVGSSVRAARARATRAGSTASRKRFGG